MSDARNLTMSANLRGGSGKAKYLSVGLGAKQPQSTYGSCQDECHSGPMRPDEIRATPGFVEIC